MRFDRNLARAFKALLCIALTGIFSATAHAATIIAAWDFQTTTSGGTAVLADPNTPTTFLANLGSQAGTAAIYANGTNGSSTWVTTTAQNELNGATGSTVNTAGTGLSTTTATPAALALVNKNANGKAITLSFSMSGFTNLAVSYATNGTATGFNSDQWSYSTDGSTFTNFGSAIVPGTNYGLITLPTLNALDNAAGTVFLKLTFAGATGTTGSNHLDNIQLNALVVPEPSTFVTLLGGVGLLVGFRRLRRANEPSRRARSSSVV